MLLDAILKLHQRISEEPLGARRAATLLEQGFQKAELIPSSERYAKKKG
jgi:NADH-quinone oxidoreductase subunit B